MAPRSLLSAGLAALIAALLAVPASAQELRAAPRSARWLRSRRSAGLAPAAMPTGRRLPGRVAGGEVRRWRSAAVDAFGAPVGPLRTIPKTVGVWDPTELRLLPVPGGGAALVTREVEDGSGYERVMLRRLAADGTPTGGPVARVRRRADIGPVDALRLADGSVLVAIAVERERTRRAARAPRRARRDGRPGERGRPSAGATSASYVTRPALAPAAGGALLAYNAEAASGFDEVFLQRLDAAGRRSGAPTQLTQSEGNGLDTDGGARWPALGLRAIARRVPGRLGGARGERSCGRSRSGRSGWTARAVRGARRSRSRRRRRCSTTPAVRFCRRRPGVAGLARRPARARRRGDGSALHAPVRAAPAVRGACDGRGRVPHRRPGLRRCGAGGSRRGGSWSGVRSGGPRGRSRGGSA